MNSGINQNFLESTSEEELRQTGWFLPSQNLCVGIGIRSIENFRVLPYDFPLTLLSETL